MWYRVVEYFLHKRGMEGGEQMEQGRRAEEDEADSSDARIDLEDVAWCGKLGIEYRGRDRGGKRGKRGETRGGASNMGHGVKLDNI